MNECDNCKESFISEWLIWLTADGFAPLDGEVIPEWAYLYFDALCDNCYDKLINGELKEQDLKDNEDGN